MTIDKLYFLNDAVFTQATKRLLHDKHDKVGRSGSTLLKVIADIETLCKGIAPALSRLTLTEAPGSCQETYTVILPAHTLDISVTNHNATNPISKTIRYPDTVRAINGITADMERYVPEPFRGYLQSFVMSVFHHNADTCVFIADGEDGDWYIGLYDAINRTHAEIQIGCISPEARDHLVDKVKSAVPEMATA